MKRAGAILLVGAVAALAWVLLRGDRPEPPRAVGGPSTARQAETGHLPAPPRAEPGAPGERSEKRAGPAIDRVRADAIRAALRAIFAEAGATAPAAEPSATADGPRGALGAPLAPMPAPEPDDAGNSAQSAIGRYIRERVREDFFPLAKQCYESELAKDPGLRGRAVLHFRIVGDKRIGGVVDEASIDIEKSELKSQGFAQCLSESMMTVSFGAPPEGHAQTTVTYPIVFSPDEDGG